MEDEITIMDRS